MRKVLVLILIACLFSLTGCCPEDTTHISNYDLWDLTDFYLNDNNTHSYWDFEEAYCVVYGYLYGEEEITLEEAQQALEIMNLYTYEMKSEVDDARFILESVEDSK